MHEAGCLLIFMLLTNIRVIVARHVCASGDNYGDWLHMPGTLKVLGPVNRTAAKTILSYSSLSPRTRTRMDWRNFDSCRVGLIESKPSKCMAPDMSVSAILHAVGMDFLSAERVWCVYRANQCC
jgi:hypothetical protein